MKNAKRLTKCFAIQRNWNLSLGTFDEAPTAQLTVERECEHYRITEVRQDHVEGKLEILLPRLNPTKNLETGAWNRLEDTSGAESGPFPHLLLDNAPWNIGRS